MPRSRVTEVPQRLSPRGGPPHIRTSSSNSDPLHHRPVTKLSDGRSVPLNKKKLGTRIADLESQLGQAQGELKSLKDQLASAESAKKAAQEQFDKKSKKSQNPESVEMQKETDVFEVPSEKVTMELECTIEVSTFDELALKKDEIDLLKNKFVDKDKELETMCEENEKLKSELNENLIKLSSAQTGIEEMNVKLDKANREIEMSKNNIAQISEKLYVTEKAKEELEDEMKRLRVQTGQWRKAADAAASILAGGMEMNGRMISERCGSMDKHYGNNVFEARSSGYRGYVGSPGGAIDDCDDVFGGGKKKGSSGIRMFGDLWRKKGHK